MPEVLIKNRSATFEYAIEDRLTAGIVLSGSEIKSVRNGKVSFNDSYCYFHRGEIFIKSLHIAEYSHGTSSNHDPTRDRKLLLTKKELRKIESKIKEKGITVIPLRIFFSEKGIIINVADHRDLRPPHSNNKISCCCSDIINSMQCLVCICRNDYFISRKVIDE